MCDEKKNVIGLKFWYHPASRTNFAEINDSEDGYILLVNGEGKKELVWAKLNRDRKEFHTFDGTGRSFGVPDEFWWASLPKADAITLRKPLEGTLDPEWIHWITKENCAPDDAIHCDENVTYTRC